MTTRTCGYTFRTGVWKEFGCAIELTDNQYMCQFHESVVRRFKATKPMWKWVNCYQPTLEESKLKYKQFPRAEMHEEYDEMERVSYDTSEDSLEEFKAVPKRVINLDLNPVAQPANKPRISIPR